MSDTLKLANSIWPNGMQVDSDGHAVFYPLGTNKVDVPTSSSAWPKGNKLVSPFVYDENDKLVGFADTKAMTASEPTTINLPYTHIEVDFSSIDKGMLTITAPNASVKKVLWSGGIFEDFIEINFKYKGCKTLNDVKAVDSNYKTNDIIDGVWTESLADLEQGGNGQHNGGMFNYCDNLTSFSADLSSLTNGYGMFKRCPNLTSFTSDLPILTNGSSMFEYCSNLKSFTSDLSNLTDGNWMFSYCSNLESFNADLSSLTNGEYMFDGCYNLKSFTSNLSKLTNCYNMFRYCSKLESFNADLSSLTDGYNMFDYCKNLTSFNADLSSLTDGREMFNYCENLTSFTSDLSSLTNGYMMFSYTNLASFSSDLPSLTDGNSMFYRSNLESFSSDLSSLTNGQYMFLGCDALTSFTSDLSNLTNGEQMFSYTNLASFSSDLSSLTEGYWMFQGCKLDTASVQNIADTINTYNGTIDVGIGNSTPNEQEESAFNTIASKGWTVYVNGSEYLPTSPAAITTLDETGQEITTPIPFWAKPVQSDEEHAKYVDSEGNFFNILGGQFIYGDDISTYGMFTCEADAAANMRLTPYVKPQTETINQN